MGPTLPDIKNDCAGEDHQQFTWLDWNELQVSSGREITAEGSISWSQRSCMKLAWDGRQPARMWARKKENVRRWKPLPSNVTEDANDNDLSNVVTSCKGLR
jgi:hypothetical protein